jgi:uncharacterized membrane protein YgcG
MNIHPVPDRLMSMIEVSYSMKREQAVPSIIVLMAVALFAAHPVHAQEPEGAEGISAYSVARLKVLDGSVWVRTATDEDWEEFSTNSPVPPGSRISVPASSEGELQFHGGQYLLLTAGTDLEARELKESGSSFRIRAGEIRLDLPPDDFAPVSVRVPGGARVEIVQPGKYWLVGDEGNRFRLVVRSGEATVFKDDSGTRVQGGEQAVIGERVQVARYGDPEAATPPAGEYDADVPVPPSVSNELRDYGEWVYVAESGWGWRPYVATGWTPYVYGRWVWISPYGWTWVSYEPWGWYPYRCGYWAMIPTFGWVWYPYNAFVSVGIGVGYGVPWTPYSGYGGYPYYHRNARYYPANVRFVPEGRQVRWVPLRPGERYVPAGVRRGDASLARWDRPLESGRVFVRTGTKGAQTRDYTAIRAERQAEIRRTHPQRTRADMRPVRPEKTVQDGRTRQTRGSPNGGRGTERRPSGQYGVPAAPADGKAKTPAGGTYVPRPTTPEKEHTDQDLKPPRGKPGAAQPTVVPRKERVVPPAQEKTPAQPPAQTPAGPAAQPPVKVRESATPPPASREEFVLPDAQDTGAPGGARGGDSGGRGSGGGRGGDGGGRGSDGSGRGSGSGGRTR